MDAFDADFIINSFVPGFWAGLFGYFAGWVAQKGFYAAILFFRG